MANRTPLETRLWSRVAVVGNICECWLWTASIRNPRDGYGQIGEGGRKGKNRPAHVVAYELTFGPVPDGLVLDHLCSNPPCCNPWHLEPVTNHVNILRGVGRAAVNARAEKCVNGHDFTEENTYKRHRPGGGRICKTCVFARTRARRQARKDNA